MAQSRKGKEVAREAPDAETSPVQLQVSPALQPAPEKPERVTVNTSNITAVKHALDDAVKEYFARSYRRSHRHEDVRLALGWTGVALAFAVSLYGLKVPFKDHKGLLTAVVATYYILSGLQTLYAKYVEADQIFQGKRKVHGARIETHSLSLRSKLDRKPYDNPKYQLMLDYVHSTNNGKSLLGSRTGFENIPIRTVFDVNGVLAREALEARLAELEKAPESKAVQ